MSISERGITTLKDLDLYDSYKSLLVPKYGRAVHLRNGQAYSQFYGANREAIYTVNRKHFNFFPDGRLFENRQCRVLLWT